jgi:hypothetical protein
VKFRLFLLRKSKLIVREDFRPIDAMTHHGLQRPPPLIDRRRDRLKGSYGLMTAKAKSDRDPPLA